MNKYHYRVIVLLACYNGKKYLKEQINSILNQKHIYFDLVISDDASDDSSFDYLISNFGKHQNVKINKNKLGTGSAGSNFRELIINNTFENYDYVALSDQDDIWEDNKLISAIHYLINNDSSGYSSSVKAFWENGKTQILSQSSHQRKFDFLFEGAGQGCTYLLTTNLATEVQFQLLKHRQIINGFTYHDWLIYIIARICGYKWVFDPKPRIMYRQHSLNVIGARLSMQGIIHRLQKVKSGWYKEQIMKAYFIADTIHPGFSSGLIPVNFFSTNDSLSRRVDVAVIAFLYGRRKTSDRLFLLIFALLGWV